MITFQAQITNQRGLHARVAAKIVNSLKDKKAQVFMKKTGVPLEIKANSIIDLLLLGASYGTFLEVRVLGEEEQAVSESLKELILNKFGEKN